MKILLIGINAKYIHSNPAIYSLKACAGAYKNNIELAEYTINQRIEDIRQDIYLRKPEACLCICRLQHLSDTDRTDSSCRSRMLP